ncbi:hypothetical protein ACVWXU_001435 [Streptomyces sp. TE33382]
MPKSMTLGPSALRRMLEGFRSWWITPAAWMVCSASATCAVSASTSPPPAAPRGHRVVQRRPRDVRCGRPRFVGAQFRVDGRHCVEALHPPGRGHLLLEPLRNDASAAYSRCTTPAATALPAGVRARWTRPMPPEPSRPSSRYGPAVIRIAGSQRVDRRWIGRSPRGAGQVRNRTRAMVRSEHADCHPRLVVPAPRGQLPRTRTRPNAPSPYGTRRSVEARAGSGVSVIGALAGASVPVLLQAGVRRRSQSGRLAGKQLR